MKPSLSFTTLTVLLSRLQEVGLVFSHFLILFYFRFIFHIFLFIELRVRVSHVTQEERCRRC